MNSNKKSSDIVTELDTAESAEGTVKESYKPITDDSTNGNDLALKVIDLKNPIKMVQNGIDGDGAEEKMLEKKEEVKFIPADPQQNGEAKIDIEILSNKAKEEVTFTGMTKEELMKYANDPFWIRLRWIFFILFWLLWVAMLVGAILIIVQAPKCAAPVPLVWYKQGPLMKSKQSVYDFNENDIEIAKKIHAKGVIYELPADETYSVLTKADLNEKITKIVNSYKEAEIDVVLDVTVNYATKALNLTDEKANKTFIWFEGPKEPNNWLGLQGGPAWELYSSQRYILSQFGPGRHDLKMNETITKEQIYSIFDHLVKLGVKGLRLHNTKHFLINVDVNIKEEVDSKPGGYPNEYNSWTHRATTFQSGLGDLLNEYRLKLRNISNNEVFLSVTDDILRPEAYKTESGDFGIDLPIYGRFPHNLATGHNNSLTYLKNNLDLLGGINSTWLQWVYQDFSPGKHVHPSAYNMFLMLLRGVPVISNSEGSMQNISHASLKHCENLRKSPSFMHGEFNLHSFGDLMAYSRIKSGNPGFFVILNPTDQKVSGNFSSPSLPEKMTVDLVSDNYNISDIAVKSKIQTDDIKLSAYSAIILTYVPVKK